MLPFVFFFGYRTTKDPRPFHLFFVPFFLCEKDNDFLGSTTKQNYFASLDFHNIKLESK